MSLYNQTQGHHPIAAPLMAALTLTQGQVGRWRDCYLSDGMIVIYARIGGENREDYPDVISLLQHHPMYVKDSDESHDSTYASFYFQIPETASPELRTILDDALIDPEHFLSRIREIAATVHVDQGKLFELALQGLKAVVAEDPPRKEGKNV